MAYKIDMVTLDKIEQCVTLYTSVFNAEPWNDGWKEEDAEERLIDILNNPHYWGVGLYDNEDELLGFLLGYSEKWLDARHFYINEMCVKTELQGKGIGSKLLSSLEEHCKNNHISRINLLTARQGQAEAFYKGNDFYESPKMIMMSKWL